MFDLFLKKIFFVVFFFLLSLEVFAQSMDEVDLVAEKWCNEIKKTKSSMPAKQRLLLSFEKAMLDLRQKYGKSLHAQTNERIFYRIQRQRCKPFFDLVSVLSPDNSLIVRTTQKPTSTIAKEQVAKFKNIEHFFYFENNGSKTKVILKKNSWKSVFANNTHTFYTLHWLSDNEFKISYVRGTHKERAMTNKKGDSYHYLLLKKEKHYFELAEYVPQTNMFSRFNLYFE